ncbi:MAG: hypothetical protein MNPFHGCM_02613 [Gemmatimonadaceae bacterium]|nr:hypothetical protein [Gemmatimonadaceae bacterium]
MTRQATITMTFTGWVGLGMAQMRRGVRTVLVGLLVTSPSAEPLQSPFIFEKVRDTLGKPVEGAIVTLVDSTRRMAGAARSNHAGYHRLRAPEYAVVSVVVRIMGCQVKATPWVEIDTMDNIAADVELTPTATTFAPVRVKACLLSLRGVRALGLDPRTIGGRSATPQHIADHGGETRDCQDIVRSLTVPWIGFHNGKRCLTYRRGMGNRCVTTFVDGLRIDSLWSSPMLVPPETIDHIIVLRPTEGSGPVRRKLDRRRRRHLHKGRAPPVTLVCGLGATRRPRGQRTSDVRSIPMKGMPGVRRAFTGAKYNRRRSTQMEPQAAEAFVAIESKKLEPPGAARLRSRSREGFEMPNVPDPRHPRRQ